MKLIIGGAYQGKREYAKRVADGKIMEDFHLYVLELLKEGKNPVELVRASLSDYKDTTIICDDIFCGIVPTDPLMRRWREELGRTLALISAEADEVIRVFCGLGVKIK